MKSKFLTFCLVVVSATAASASSIQFITGGGRGHMFVTTNNTRIDAGSLVRVGYLTTPGDISTFAEFATTTISHPGATAQVGGFLTIPASSSTVAPAAKGAQIYLWVYNAPTAAGATQAGIFTSVDGAGWDIPASFTGDPTETSNLDLSLATGIVAIPDPVFGGTPSVAQGPITIGTTTATGNIFMLAVIPEPGTLALALVSCLGLLVRRRR